MEIHPPSEPIHNWRDLLIHLGVITVGLFIALTLESLVEYMHHRHIVREARENIRLEIEDNHVAAQRDLVNLQNDIDLEQKNIDNIQILRTHPKDFHGSISNTMSLDAPQDSAWRTARDSGALTYMPYDEVQRYSNIYMRETLVVNHAITTGEHDFLAAAPLHMGYDAANLPPEQYDRLLQLNSEVLIELTVLKGFVQELDNSCVEELKAQ